MWNAVIKPRAHAFNAISKSGIIDSELEINNIRSSSKQGAYTTATSTSESAYAFFFFCV